MENLAMEVAKLFAQESHQVDNDLFVEVKKFNSTNCSETSLQEEVSNANNIHNEETTTNEESIKDAQDTQSNLMKAIHTLTDFCAKVPMPSAFSR